MTKRPTAEQLAALPEWATTSQVAAVYDVDRSQVARWCRDGWIEARKPGHDWFICTASLEDWMPPRPGQYDRSQLANRA